MRFLIERHNWSCELLFTLSSQKSNNGDAHPNTHNYSSSVRAIDAPHLDQSTRSRSSAFPEPCQSRDRHRKQDSPYSRTSSIRKSFGKIMFHFSRDRSLTPGVASSMPPQIYTPYEHGHVGIAELPEDRDPCELPAHPISDLYQQMHQYDHAESDPSSAEAVAWQRHHSLSYARSSPADDIPTLYTPHAYSPALTPIDTSVEMVRTSPSNASSHYVFPNNDNGHNYRTVDVSAAMLRSPPPTISPSSIQISPTSISPTGSSVSDTETIDTTNNLLQNDSRSLCNYSNFYSHGQHSYNPIISPVLPISCHDSNPVTVQGAARATVAIHAATLPFHYLRESKDSTQTGEEQHSPSANHQHGPAHIGIANEMFQYRQMRRSAWERFVSETPFDTSSNLQHAEFMSQQTTSNPPFNFDEILPTYEQSRNAPVHLDAQLVQEVEAVPPPVSRKGEVKRTTTTAARAIMKLFPPLPCVHCGMLFNGKYQKANRNRHVNSFHLDIDDGRDCRTCHQRFRRRDARKKHEWKKHRTEDCRPTKRRIEKRDGERRIYMPLMPDVHGNVS